MSDSLFLVGLDWKIHKINNSARKLLGYSDEELQNKKIDIVFDDRSKDRLEHLYLEKELVDIDVWLKTKQGESIPVSLSSSILLNRFQNEEGFVLLFRDMHERLKTRKNPLA